MVTPALFKRYPDAKALAQATTAELEPQIHSTGFFRAEVASRSSAWRTALVERARRRGAGRHGRARRAAGRRPEDGERRARPRARRARDCRSIATCCAWPTGSASPKSDDPVVVEQQLCDALPPERWTRTSDTLILHGRRICRPKPLCDRCAVQDVCDLLQHASRRRPRRRRPQRRGKAGARRRRQRKRRKRPTASMTRARSTPSSLTRSPAFRTQFRDAMANIAIVVEDEPSPTLLARDGDRAARHAARSLSGTPLTERRWDYGNALPDRILLFQGRIERDVRGRGRSRSSSIGETLIHEIGHYFGLSEEEIEEIEEQYWHGRRRATAEWPDGRRRAQALRPALPRAAPGS